MAKLGATVAATDTAPNLPLLRRNAEVNGMPLSIPIHVRISHWSTANKHCLLHDASDMTCILVSMACF